MKLIIFANYFPYKKAEPFLVNEFEFTKTFVKKITLFSLYGKLGEEQVSEDQSISILPPVFKSASNKSRIFIQGFFNLASFKFHLKELLSVFSSFKKLYYWLVSIFVTRSILSSTAYKTLCSVLKGDEKTILYFYWGDNLCWMIPYLKRDVQNNQLKIVIRLHGSDLYENLKADYAPLRKLIFQESDLIVSISNYGKNYLSQRYPEIKNILILSRLGVFDNGLNPYQPSDTYTIVSVSNIIPLKRLGLIFEVLQKTKAPINWYHFGDGPLAQELHKLVEQCRSNMTVHLMGQVTNQQVINFYQTQSVDLFINLSTTEGLPVSIMEAFSFGIPVIAPMVGGIGDLVNEQNGRLVAVNSPVEKITDEVLNLLSSSKQLSLRKEARLTFEQKVSAQTNYTEFYSQILQI